MVTAIKNTERIKLLTPILTAVIAVILYETAVRVGNMPAYILPSVVSVVEALLAPFWFNHFVATLSEILIAFALAVITAVPLAMVITYSKVVDYAITPWLVVSQVVPKVAFAPLLVIWFGVGYFPALVLAYVLCFFPIVINSVAGFREVPLETLDLAYLYGASEWKVFRKVRMPNAEAYLLAGFRLSIALATIGAVVGEFIAVPKEGLGLVIITALQYLDAAILFAAVLILSATGVVLYGLVGAAERLLMPWKMPRE